MTRKGSSSPMAIQMPVFENRAWSSLALIARDMEIQTMSTPLDTNLANTGHERSGGSTMSTLPYVINFRSALSTRLRDD